MATSRVFALTELATDAHPAPFGRVIVVTGPGCEPAHEVGQRPDNQYQSRIHSKHLERRPERIPAFPEGGSDMVLG